MVAKVKIQGAKEIERLLRKLPDKTQGRVVDNGLRAGARIIAKDAKLRVPVDTGELRDSIVVRKAPKRRRDQARVIIGFRKPRSAIAHLIEYGTRFARAIPFLRPAIDHKGSEAIDRIGKNVGRGIEREALKLAGLAPKRRRRRRT